ncbi:MAG TPA: hypothetical protein VGM37_12580 [Armatimonadota bacterium]|jgi:hypothetical protein
METRRDTSLSVAVCSIEHDITLGLLNSAQSLTWVGLPISHSSLAALPRRMDQEHFRAVERSVLGLIRCSVLEDRVDCMFLGIVPVLRFEHPELATGPDRVSRTWLITGGWQARREASLGSLTLEWTNEPRGDGQTRHCVSARVHGYPSRFLPHSMRGRPGPIRRCVASTYARYHGIVTCRYLRRLARWIDSLPPRAETA